MDDEGALARMVCGVMNWRCKELYMLDTRLGLFRSVSILHGLSDAITLFLWAWNCPVISSSLRFSVFSMVQWVLSCVVLLSCELHRIDIRRWRLMFLVVVVRVAGCIIVSTLVAKACLFEELHHCNFIVSLIQQCENHSIQFQCY